MNSLKPLRCSFCFFSDGYANGEIMCVCVCEIEQETDCAREMCKHKLTQY